MDGLEIVESGSPKAGGASQNNSMFSEIAQRYLDSIRIFGDRNRLVANYEQYYWWTGSAYSRLTDAEVNRLFRNWCDENGIHQNNRIVGNVMPVVASRLRHTKRVMPFWDRADGPVGDFIAFRNGILSVDSAVAGNLDIQPHDCTYLNPVVLPFDFDPSAECPQWLAFLAETFGEGNDRIRFLQEWFGYCLTSDNPLQVFLLMTGPGGAGKGVVAKVMQGLVGEQNYTGFSLENLCSRFGSGQLVNMRLAIVGEVEMTQWKQNLIVENLKKVTGGDPVSIEYKGMNETLSMPLPVKFIITANKIPDFREPTPALARRMLPLIFDRKAKHRDIHLPEKLYAELPGICNWAIEGLRRLKKTDQFTIPETSQQRLREYCRQSSPVRAFLEDCCEVCETANPGNLDGVTFTSDFLESRREDIYRHACEYLKEEYNIHSISSHKFWADIRALLPLLQTNSSPRKDRSNPEKIVTYRPIKGIRLKPEIAAEQAAKAAAEAAKLRKWNDSLPPINLPPNPA